jgi:FkbM family methyltransferase
MSDRIISYAQRFEDLYLLSCFDGRRDGFYIDIGSGHPVYDNSSLLFYLKGWRGITVEPNPSLSRLTRAVRRRDRHIEASVGAVRGEGTFYLVNDYHGLSTMIESHAHSALSQFGKTSEAFSVPVTTLRAVCEQHAPASFEFLKVDVEGAEQDVLLHGDWLRFRPRVVVVEALAPYTLAPAWNAWEPFLARYGYRYAWFDSLNRYYLAEEAGELGRCFEAASAMTADAVQFRNVKPALEDATHPDHRLAKLLAGVEMATLPLQPADALCELLTADISAADLEQPANAEVIGAAAERLFGPDAVPLEKTLNLPPSPRLRDVYRAIIDTDRFHIACGRISASYAW